MSELKTAEEIFNQYGLSEDPLDIEVRNAMREYAIQVAEAVRDECIKSCLYSIEDNRLKAINLTQFIK